jgi:hypothetical protein
MKHVPAPVRVITVTLVTMTALFTTALPASAHERTIRDPRGDAPASADLTRVTVRNGAKAVSLVLKVRNLQRLSDTTIYVDHRGPGRFAFRTAGTRRGLLTFERRGPDKRVPCTSRRVSRHTGVNSRMIVRIPQRCFRGRAGRATFDVTMWQAGGQGSDRVQPTPFVVRRG